MKQVSLFGRALGAAAIFLAACGQGGGSSGTGAQAIGKDAPAETVPGDGDQAAATNVKLSEINGALWFYTTQDGIKFVDLTAKLDDLHAKGIRMLGIYSPYHGNPDKWIGAAPLDYYATSPESGSLDDFRALVKAAHTRGMKVVTYFVSIYIDHESEFFKKAEAQYRAGDRTSREVSAFHWTDDPNEALPSPAAGPDCSDPDANEEGDVCTKWRKSETAGAYYWSLWGEAGFDFNLAGARAEVAKFTKFWLDIGVDGFMFDAAIADPKLKEALVDIPTTYTPNDKWLTFESTEGENQAELDAFGLTSWFNASDDDTGNDYSYVAAGDDNADSLEEEFKHVDYARAHGKTTFAWSPLEAKYADEAKMLPQEAALLAGAGMLYGSPMSSFDEKWAPSTHAAWDKVLVTINANLALHPSGARKRVPTGSHPKQYAMTRTSADGSQSALLVYNLQGSAARVTMDLGDAGISLSQTPKDLHAGKTMPAITGASYSLDLPAYGFEILGVRR